MSKQDSEQSAATKLPLVHRLHRAFGPLAGGLLLDGVDLATFGPFGIGGLFIGAFVGWWISALYGFSGKVRLFWALVAGIYCLTPATELLPLATIVSAIARFRTPLPMEEEDGQS